MPNKFPELGHIGSLRKIDVADPLDRAYYEPRGKHLVIGQRKQRGRSDALIYLGKCIEQTRVSNKYDANVWLDIRTPHVIYICGKRGSGKSYDLGIIAEGLLLDSSSKITTKDIPITTIIFDTQSQFWSLGDAPQSALEEDREQITMLEQWGISPSTLPNVTLLKPKGEITDLAAAKEFVLDPSELDVDDWCGLFGLERYSPQGQCIRSILEKVTRDGYEEWQDLGGRPTRVQVPAISSFEITDLINCLRRDIDIQAHWQQQTRDAVMWKLESLVHSKLFERGGMNIRDVLKPGTLSIFLLRNLDNATKALVVSIFSKKIFTLMGEYHTKRKVARRMGGILPSEYQDLPEGVWVLIDEAHLICPADSQTAAKPTLIEFVKRGRDAGLSLVLATQQPSAVDSRVVSQVDLLIAHRLVVDSDIAAAISRLPARFPSSVTVGTERITEPGSLVRILDTREAWVGDAESGRAFLIAMRPRVSAHGGDEPTIV
ncbi:MAG: hypothetical protein QOH70_1470 [Blastocatellia bacterium]|jgi:DNA helicase HerA-like ATPase|nr:hypothetical protein [Blastocatellia bacterium]